MDERVKYYPEILGETRSENKENIFEELNTNENA